MKTFDEKFPEIMIPSRMIGFLVSYFVSAMRRQMRHLHEQETLRKMQYGSKIWLVEFEALRNL